MCEGRIRYVLFLLLLMPCGGHAQGRPTVTGGLRALAAVAKIRPDTSPDQFAVEYAQAIVSHTESSTTARTYIDGLHTYFQTLDELHKRMATTSNGLETTLDVNEYGDFIKAKDILKFLGWRATANLAGTLIAPMIVDVKVEMGNETGDAQRQSISSNFGVDFPGLKSALERKRPSNCAYRRKQSRLPAMNLQRRPDFSKDLSITFRPHGCIWPLTAFLPKCGLS
jgi:hypothetical protein